MKNKAVYQLIGSFCLVFFVILGYMVKFYPKMLVGFDSTIQNFIRHSMNDNLTIFYKIISKAVSATEIIIMTLLIALVLLVRKEKITAIFLVSGVVSILGIIAPILKLVYLRERPNLEHLVVETSKSFPSGHSSSAMIFFGTLTLIAWQLFKNKPLKIIISGLAITLICLVGISRVYLGVHYPSDVLGAYLLGGAWLGLSYPYFVEWRIKDLFKKIGGIK